MTPKSVDDRIRRDSIIKMACRLCRYARSDHGSAAQRPFVFVGVSCVWVCAGRGLVRAAGVEPAWAKARAILSRQCLPFHHARVSRRTNLRPRRGFRRRDASPDRSIWQCRGVSLSGTGAGAAPATASARILPDRRIAPLADPPCRAVESKGRRRRRGGCRSEGRPRRRGRACMRGNGDKPGPSPARKKGAPRRDAPWIRRLGARLGRVYPPMALSSEIVTPGPMVEHREIFFM